MTFADAPIDPESAERLAGQGLRLGLVDTRDTDAFAAWLQAVARGFHNGQASERSIAEHQREAGYRRTTGVWDDSAADAATPVATTSAWPTPLTVPGERSLPAWAISSVSVAPTHRRHGIGRALLEAELRTAASLGIPAAVLTASEATIYGRYGFAPAAMAANLSIQTRRARWSGPQASGRVQLFSLLQLHEEGRRVLDRARLQVPGEIELDNYLWGRLIGVLDDEDGQAKHRRAVRYDDVDGVPQGFAVYRVTESKTDFTKHTATVIFLCAATDDAAAGLWRYLLELDLVSTLEAPLRPVDDPVLWQIADFRAARKTQRSDHLWLRILDVAATLEARRYSAPGQILLEVHDPLGYAEARVLLSIDSDGAATVAPTVGAAPDVSAGLALGVNELGALYLGGVTATTLVRAGRVTELRPGSADVVDAVFRSRVAPWLSSWF